MEEGKQSLAIEATLQPRDKSQTDEVISRISNAIVASVEKQLADSCGGNRVEFQLD